MKWEIWLFPALAMGAGAIATFAGLGAAGAKVPPPPPPDTFLMQSHQTGTVGPAYFRTDTLTVDKTGAWTALRRFPYAQPPVVSVLASGSLSVAQMRQLQELAMEPTASGDPAFADLPDTSGKMLPGAGTRRLAILLPDGQMHDVIARGAAPPAFERLDSAVASATVDMGSLGPFRAH